MELGGKLLNSLRIETQFLERLQSVSVVDGAAHTQKDDVGSNRGFLENFVAKVFVLLPLPHCVLGNCTATGRICVFSHFKNLCVSFVHMHAHTWTGLFHA